MIKIKTLSSVQFNEIHRAFANAFSDYVVPFDLSVDELEYMFERRGYDLSLSFGAFEGEKLVGLTVNGIGNWNGKPTAYDSGTGVIKDYRKRGIAKKMFSESLPVLKSNGIEQYLLEVIKSNTGAFNLYKKEGFKVVRELDYYHINKYDIIYRKPIDQSGFKFRVIEKPDWKLLKSFWDFQPSWQNSIDSLKRKIEFLKILCAYKNSELAGYGIIESHTGDIPLIAVSGKYRRKGLASSLFRVIINYSDVQSLKLINADSSYGPFKDFMRSMEIKAGANMKVEASGTQDVKGAMVNVKGNPINLN